MTSKCNIIPIIVLDSWGLHSSKQCKWMRGEPIIIVTSIDTKSLGSFKASNGPQAQNLNFKRPRLSWAGIWFVPCGDFGLGLFLNQACTWPSWVVIGLCIEGDHGPG